MRREPRSGVTVRVEASSSAGRCVRGRVSATTHGRIPTTVYGRIPALQDAAAGSYAGHDFRHADVLTPRPKRPSLQRRDHEFQRPGVRALRRAGASRNVRSRDMASAAPPPGVRSRRRPRAIPLACRHPRPAPSRTRTRAARQSGRNHRRRWIRPERRPCGDVTGAASAAVMVTTDGCSSCSMRVTAATCAVTASCDRASGPAPALGSGSPATRATQTANAVGEATCPSTSPRAPGLPQVSPLLTDAGAFAAALCKSCATGRSGPANRHLQRGWAR